MCLKLKMKQLLLQKMNVQRKLNLLDLYTFDKLNVYKVITNKCNFRIIFTYNDVIYIEIP